VDLPVGGGERSPSGVVEVVSARAVEATLGRAEYKGRRAPVDVGVKQLHLADKATGIEIRGLFLALSA
jgi:hypothetical protein